MKKTLIVFIITTILILCFSPSVNCQSQNLCLVTKAINDTFHTTSQKSDFKQESSPLKKSYVVQQVNINFESSNYKLYGEIYYPADQSQTYPCLVFCEGFPGYVSAYNWIPKALAEHGYVVIIYDPPDLGKSEGLFPNNSVSVSWLNAYFRFGSYISTPVHYLKREWAQAASDALTYLTDESPVKHLVNQSNVGLIGHSFGGITATEVVIKDKRFDTVVAMSHGNSFIIRKVDVPLLFICGDFDLGLKSIPTTLACYQRANTPKELIMIQLGTHFGFTTAFNSLCPCPPWQKDIIIHYANAWFEYFLKQDTKAYAILTTGTDHLSSVFKSRYNFGAGEHILT